MRFFFADRLADTRPQALKARSAVPHPMLSRFMHPEKRPGIHIPTAARIFFIPGMARSERIVPMIAFSAKHLFIEGSLSSSCNC